MCIYMYMYSLSQNFYHTLHLHVHVNAHVHVQCIYNVYMYIHDIVHVHATCTCKLHVNEQVPLSSSFLVLVVHGLIDRVEVLLVRVGECEGVLEEGEGRMTECGPIGADLDRLIQQQEILNVSIYMFAIGAADRSNWDTLN